MGLDMKSFLKTAFSHLYDLEEKMNDLYENIQDGDFQNLNTAARYQEELERQDFYLIDTKVEQVATGLGLLAIGLDRPIAQMSGGQRAKVILAKLLLEKPDVLLLDEPTNFLDKEHIKKTEEFIRKNIAGRKSKMARGRQKQLDRMDKMETIDQKEIVPFFHFREMPLTNTEHLNVKHLSVGYHYPVLSDINFAVNGGQKVVITGFNGIGKSTLLKTLVGQIRVLNGSFSFSEQVKLQYFEQDLCWKNAEKTPIQIVSDCYPSLTIKEVRKNLACTLNPCNFIIMDEPTNHLDIQAKQSLRTALKEFKGTVLLVSHEPDFYKEWIQKMINIENIVKKG